MQVSSDPYMSTDFFNAILRVLEENERVRALKKREQEALAHAELLHMARQQKPTNEVES